MVRIRIAGLFLAILALGRTLVGSGSMNEMRKRNQLKNVG